LWLVVVGVGQILGSMLVAAEVGQVVFAPEQVLQLQLGRITQLP